MGIQDLQAFLESASLEGSVSVDLLKIARNVAVQRQHNRKIRPPIGNNKLKLIIDAENCLDRLYGGYFSDWACGGQWNRMYQFLTLLTQAIERGNIEFAIMFNGSIENTRMDEWIAEQATVRQRVGMVLKHINTKATPPPKIWWTAPICLRTALRMALRHLGISVMCTMDDHHQEVIAYCREYGFHGLLADDAEYAVFDPPRYFSSEHMKLTYKGSLETKEYMVSELSKHLQLTQEQICVLAALLGNFLMPETELQDIHKKVLSTFGKDDQKMQGDTTVKLLAEYIRTLPSTNNLEAIASEIFGAADTKRCKTFKHSVMYYLNGTALGYLKLNHPKNYRKDMKMKMEQGMNNLTIKEEVVEFDTSGFASETTEQEQESLKNYKLATVNQIISSDIISIDTDSSTKSSPNDESPPSSDTSRFNGHATNGNSESIACTSTSSTNLLQSVSSSSANSNAAESPKDQPPPNNNTTSNIIHPNVSSDVLRTASLRHQKGLMCSWILHVLNTKEVRLPCVMEDEGNREFPPIHEIYQPLRQRIYAVLFNLHHHRYVHNKNKEAKGIPDGAPLPDVIVKEWVYSRSNPYQFPEEVKAAPLPWAVPTLQRLWFGPSVDDKRRRMRALLSCLNSDTPLILNISYVPQHMLVMACVLRYIMSQDKAILRRAELDVFLAQAFNPDLMNTQYLQELTLNVVTSRGVQLAAVFMQGVEMTLLTNDACGAPLPWLMCCPWLYFDGKLFHHTLTRATQAKTLLDLCENHIERVVKVERIRKAILEGLDAKFAKVPMPHFTGHIRSGLPPPNCLPSVPLPSSRGATNLRHRPMPSRGGQLQIAGVVVGSWGANYGYQNLRPPQQQHHHHHQHQQQQQQQQQMMGGYNHRHVNNNSAPRTGNFQPQPYNNQHSRGGSMMRPRKTGAPTYAVNKKNTSNNKKKAASRQRHNSGGNRNGKPNAIAEKTENGETLATDKLKEHSTEGDAAAIEDFNGPGTEHQGQGDGPSVAC